MPESGFLNELPQTSIILNQSSMGLGRCNQWKMVIDNEVKIEEQWK